MQISIHIRSCESKKCLCNAKLIDTPQLIIICRSRTMTFSRVYSDAALFEVKFFGMDELITQSNVTLSDYKTLYPIFTFDGKQKEKLKSSVVDIQKKANFTENVPANTRSFALVILEKMLLFQSDDNKMSVIY